MRSRATGFTLIELLVAVTLSMIVIAMAWSLFSQSQALIKRTQARAELHQQAATIHANLAAQCAGMHPGGLIKARASTVPASVPGPSAGATRIDLWFLHTPERVDTTYGFSPRIYENDWDSVSWVKWRWERPAGGIAGVLSVARSPRYWDHWWQGARVSATSSTDRQLRIVRNAPWPRRDASRDLNDNDGRLLANFPHSHVASDPASDGTNVGWANADTPASTVYPAASLNAANPSLVLGDDEILDHGLRTIHPQVVDLSIGWLDGASPPTAGTVLGAADAAAGRTISANGVFLGYIQHSAAWTTDPFFAAAPSSLGTADIAKRPLVLRIAFVLVDPSVRLSDAAYLQRQFGTATPTLDQILASKDVPWQAFSFSMPLSAIGAAP
jgi:type II secretory pathway pseudopilin PulG